jgi:hypothetical protein
VAEVLGLDPEDKKTFLKKAVRELVDKKVLARKLLPGPKREPKTFIVPGNGGATM